jgi:DNA replication protein DnaC
VNLIELERALRQLRLGGIAAVLETRLHQAQAEAMAPIDLISCLVTDELTRRSERLLERRRKQAAFRDPNKTLDNFDFTSNPKMNRSLVFDLAKLTRIQERRSKVSQYASSWTARRIDGCLVLPPDVAAPGCSRRAGGKCRFVWPFGPNG